MGGGITPLPPTTAGGFDWCNPEPTHFTPGLIGVPGLPTATKGCPLPAATALGGQNGVREQAPVNHSYGLQLALAWDQPASISTRIPAASGDVTAFKALSLGAAVNFFDPRNPVRTPDAIWNPGLTTQDFTISVTDKAGKVGTVSAASPRYGTALHQTTGGVTNRTHIVLNQVRVPLSDFAAQGVDLAALRKLELEFGGAGLPATGSIQLSDVRFQEAAAGTKVYTDKLADVPPTAPAPALAPETRTQSAAVTATIAAPSAVLCETASAAIASTRVVKRRLTVTGATSACAKAVRVTVAKVGSSRTTEVKATLRSSKWTAAKAFAKGRYRVTVTAVATTGGRAAAARSRTIIVK